jgi:hypothetical protein
MRRIAGSILLALVLSLASIGTALGHVHAVTPLGGGCDNPPPANENAGGNGTNGTPADNDSENEGPIVGVIPNDATRGDQPGEAGQHSSLCDEEE